MGNPRDAPAESSADIPTQGSNGQIASSPTPDGMPASEAARSDAPEDPTSDAAPLPIARTTLNLFEIPEIGCDGMSEILLHAIDQCRPQNEDNMDCFPIVDLVSRASVRLVK